MTTQLNGQSSFGSVIFTTNIPGGKEYTLDPRDILYSDNINFKPINTSNKLFYYSDKIINHEYLQSKTRSNMLNILFNKNRFEQINENNFSDASELERKQVVSGNFFEYIGKIFTTYPKSYNIKKTSDINNQGGLKFLPMFENIPYTYLNVNGTVHTVSRVVYYDDKQKEDVAIELLNDYSEFEKWYKDIDIFKVFINPLIKDFRKLFDDKMVNNNLINTFGERDKVKTPNFYEDIQDQVEYIDSINKYLNESVDIPSNKWTVQQFNKNFFSNSTDNGTNLLNDDTIIMEKIIEIIKKFSPDNQIILNKTINQFIKDVHNNHADILTKVGILNLKGHTHVQKFKELVEKLNKQIKTIFGESWNDHLWLGSEPQFKDKPLTKKMPVNDWEKEIIDSENRIKVLEEQKEVYENFNSGSVIIARIMSDLVDYKYKRTVESQRSNEEINNFSRAIETIFEKYKSLSILNDKFKNSQINNIDDYIKEAYKDSRIIYDQLKQIKKPAALSNSLFPSHKFKDILELLNSFQNHYKIYNSFKQKMYTTDILNSQYNKYSRYKEYVNFIKKIKTIYEYNDDFKLADMNSMIAEGELVVQRKNKGFENESIRLHIDLIKGRVSDENIKQISCEYKDNDLVNRWNKFGLLDDGKNDITHMHYFTIKDKDLKNKKQIKNGGKFTKRYRRKKHIQTRKR
jgi:predicted  nucleic acid-binding Zn-ribbon protein